MKAIIQHGYGAPADVLTLDEVDKPAVGDEQVLVRVRATSVNSGDWRQVRARPFIIRFTLGLRRPKNGAFGGDAAGVVEAVGKDVTHVKPGDEVFGIRTGAFADYVSGKNFVAKPAQLTFEEAAAMPVAGVTALQAVRDHGNVKAGQRVLINGAGGGVGHLALQIAKSFGAEVTAVTSTDKLEMVRSIGADHVIDYKREDFTKGGKVYDVIIDCGGDHSFGACRRALAGDGRLIVVGAYRGVLARLLVGTLRRRLLGQPIIFFLASVKKDDLLTLKELVEGGKIRAIIDRTYSLSETPAAIGYAEKQSARGKVVITVPA
jgi:NADPH:quinone reductase-like Zn-dependent oxidoreductase